MRAIRSRDTKPEMAVRRLVHGMGYRYRLHQSDLPGRPDIVFAGRRAVLFVHGCFWHSHGCGRTHTPRSNTTYWGPKLGKNRKRDREHLLALSRAGWRTMVVWECEVADAALPRRLKQFLGRARQHGA